MSRSAPNLSGLRHRPVPTRYRYATLLIVPGRERIAGDEVLDKEPERATASGLVPPPRAMTGYRGTPRCTIRTRGQHHPEASVGSGGIPQCWRSGMPGRLHIWRTHPADLHPGRAQGDLRAQRRLMVQGRLGGWLLRASVSSLRPAPLACSSEREEPEGAPREGDSSTSGETSVQKADCPQHSRYTT